MRGGSPVFFYCYPHSSLRFSLAEINAGPFVQSSGKVLLMEKNANDCTYKKCCTRDGKRELKFEARVYNATCHVNS